MVGVRAPDLTPDTSWTLPERVVRAFSRSLSPTSDQSTMPKPEEVTDAHLIGRVVARAGNTTRFVLLGQISTSHLYQGRRSTCRLRLTGLGSFNTDSRSLRAVTLLGEGIFRPAPPYTEDRPIAAAIEWRAAPEHPAQTP